MVAKPQDAYKIFLKGVYGVTFFILWGWLGHAFNKTSYLSHFPLLKIFKVFCWSSEAWHSPVSRDDKQLFLSLCLTMSSKSYRFPLCLNLFICITRQCSSLPNNCQSFIIAAFPFSMYLLKVCRASVHSTNDTPANFQSPKVARSTKAQNTYVWQGACEIMVTVMQTVSASVVSDWLYAPVTLQQWPERVIA